jgi:hypothetical protein
MKIILSFYVDLLVSAQDFPAMSRILTVWSSLDMRLNLVNITNRYW